MFDVLVSTCFNVSFSLTLSVLQADLVSSARLVYFPGGAMLGKQSGKGYRQSVRTRTKKMTGRKHDMRYSYFRRSGGDLTALHSEALFFGDGASEREGRRAIVICSSSSLILLLQSLAVFAPDAGVECNLCI
ncbi:hypothetical protein ACFX12_035511 [Malus domestica]